MRNVTILILALPAAVLSGTMLLHSRYFGRGAGAVELGICIVLLILAAPMAVLGMRSKTSVERVVACMVLAMMPLIALGTAWRVKLNREADAELAGCSANLTILAGALGAHAREHGGALPDHLSDALAGPIPACPAGGEDTYSSGYERAPETGAYTVYCASSAHCDHVYDPWQVSGPGYPQFSSPLGKVITRPER